MSAPTSPQPIELIFKYSHKTFTIETTQEATLGELRQLLHKQTEVAPALQKIMFKGKALSNDSTKLTEFKLRNKEKLLLVGSSIQEVLKVAEQSEQTTETSKDDEKVYLSDLPQHKKIIEKGVPEEAIKGFRNRHESLPTTPLKGIYNNRGGKVRLTFKTFTEELWISTESNTQKLPFSSIRNVISEPIRGNEDYHIMTLQLGSSDTTKYYLYFVPAQYTRAIKNSIMHDFSSL
eukprot:TRINITY_DN1327_c0_g2_i3.p1 TRINITY_DN1327_c0_g2~~TRINITY_DN1327_c0_g2_i3.p1  ORF type:complete len:234 (+),score=31.57 TRINITY_DN1327_c0_g2_i3:86-787(+)